MSIGIVGLGHAAPTAVRRNDDPVFAALVASKPVGADLFTGYRERRVLAPEGRIVDLLVEAARAALVRAATSAEEIDLVLGCDSFGEFVRPSELAAMHDTLGLPARAGVIPLGNEFSNFSAGIVLADAMIRAGRAKKALVACGSDWTRHVDYTTAPSVSASDAAGAAVLARADAPKLTVVAFETETASRYYGSMVVRDHFEMNATGRAGFSEFGLRAPVGLARRVLEAHGVAPADVTLVSHQASRVLLDAWGEGIGPGAQLETLEQFGNMTAASIAFNLSYFADRLDPPIRPPPRDRDGDAHERAAARAAKLNRRANRAFVGRHRRGSPRTAPGTAGPRRGRPSRRRAAVAPRALHAPLTRERRGGRRGAPRVARRHRARPPPLRDRRFRG